MVTNDTGKITVSVIERLTCFEAFFVVFFGKILHYDKTPPHLEGYITCKSVSRGVFFFRTKRASQIFKRPKHLQYDIKLCSESP